jgi:hypothetical protein
MSKTAQRRRTDPRTHRQRDAELTAEQKQDLFMRGLAAEVSRACVRWLRARGIPPGSLIGDYPAKSAAVDPEPSSRKPEACQPSASLPHPRDGSESLAARDEHRGGSSVFTESSF